MKRQKYTKDDFYQSIEDKNTEQTAEMIRTGVLEEMEHDELLKVFRKLMSLRNRDVIDQLAKRSRYFPVEMLDVNIANYNDKEFVSYVLTKHGKKFRFKTPENARMLFQTAVKAECRPMLLFLLGKGLAEGEYPRLASASDPVFEVVREIKPSGLHPDTVVTFFVEAAISGQEEKRIPELIELGFDRFTLNSEGLDACEVLNRGIKTYPYPKGKKGAAEKQRDLNGLKTLQRFCSNV